MEPTRVIIVRDEDYLAHHGVKGQKWGVRRYQNEDGSLTAEGQRQRQKIEKWYNSKSGMRQRARGEKKGYNGFDLYKANRMNKAGTIGWMLGGITTGLISSAVSESRVMAGREFFEKEIARLDQQSKQA